MTPGEYHDTVIRLAEQTGQAINNLWQQMPDYTVSRSLQWHDAAADILEASAQAAADIAEAFAGDRFDTTANVDRYRDAVIRDSRKEAWTPFDVLADRLGKGLDWGVALEQANNAVEALGIDATMQAARRASGWAFAQVGETFVRRLDPKACDWCMSFASVEFYQPEEADFGHDNCKCLPMPKGMVGGANEDAVAESGFDPDEFRTRKEVRSLEKRRETALKRQQRAAAEQLTETDPDRLERLSIREQEWETAVEVFDEQIRFAREGRPRRRR